MASTDEFRSVRLRRALNRGLQILLAALLALGLNLLAARPGFYFRRDISASRERSLSLETLAQLRILAPASAKSDEPLRIRIYRTLPPSVPKDDEASAKYAVAVASINDRIDGLLDAFSYELARDARVEMSVLRADPRLHAKDYGDISGMLLNRGRKITPMTALVIACGDRIVPLEAGDLISISGKAENAVVNGFRGEAALLSALLEVTDFRRPVVYFTQNHGELAADASSPLRSSARLVAELRARRFEVRTLNLENEKDIPVDAALLVVAGPRERFRPRETDMIRRYLRDERNGRMMLLLEPLAELGFDDLYYDWGLIAPKALLVETGREYRAPGGNILVSNIAPHETTAVLSELRLPLYGGAWQSVGADPGAPLDSTVRVTAIFASSKDFSWGESEPGRTPVYESKSGDIPPPVILGAVAARDVRVQGESRIPGGRLMLVGSADIAADSRFDLGGNRQFLLASANWLSGREYLTNVPPRPITSFRVNATADDLVSLAKRYAIIPLSIAAFGLLVFWWRRRV